MSDEKKARFSVASLLVTCGIGHVARDLEGELTLDGEVLACHGFVLTRDDGTKLRPKTMFKDADLEKELAHLGFEEFSGLEILANFDEKEGAWCVKCGIVEVWAASLRYALIMLRYELQGGAGRGELVGTVDALEKQLEKARAALAKFDKGAKIAREKAAKVAMNCQK